MGGLGSGTWWREQPPKMTVEACRVLAVQDLPKPLNVGTSGAIQWPRNRRLPSSVHFTVLDEVQSRSLLLQYSAVKRKNVELAIPLMTTPMRFGGVRWWFSCPRQRVGNSCGRRVGKLYLPPGAFYFSCRDCHDLTYRSSQEAHRDQRMLDRLGMTKESMLQWDEIAKLLEED